MMSGLPTWSELQLLQWRFPWAALLLLLPAMLGWLARRRRQRLAHYAEPHLLPWAVLQRGEGAAGRVRKLAEMLAWGLLALAAAGPRLPELLAAQADDQAARPHVIDVMVVLDVSASMTASDVAPDRLTRAKLELTDLLQRLHGERVGLLLYAGQAGLLLPPTDDKALFARALSQAGADLLEAPGTGLARALRLATQSLTAPPANTDISRAVLLVTDADADSLQGAAGEGVQQAVRALRHDGIALFVLVTASAGGASFQLPGGVRAMREDAPVISRPALAVYRRLAQDSGGALALVADGEADWDLLYGRGLGRLPAAVAANGPMQAWRELFIWPLGLGLLLLFWSLLPPAPRPAQSLAALCLMGIVATLASPASEAADESRGQAAAQQAAKAYRAGEWQQALPLFERQAGYAGHMGAGASAWKLREYATAAHHFGQALLLARTGAERDDALYNLGNALYAQERWHAAAQAWQAVLQSRPGDARAAANLAQVQAHLARRAGTATRSDLRGHLGFAAQGLIGMDGDVPVDEAPPPLPDLPPGARGRGAADARGARLGGGDASQSLEEITLSPQQLQSGLLKLDRLQERQGDLLRGLLRQDRTPATGSETGAPW